MGCKDRSSIQFKDSFAVLMDLIFSARLTQFFISRVIFKLSLCLFAIQNGDFLLE